jgi:glycosyltransferase involved in cell wall biosynthesis
MSRGPHVAFVIPSMAPGGSERQLLMLMQGLRRDWRVSLICTRREGALFDAARACVNGSAHVLHLPSAWDPRQRRMLQALFQDLQPDLVHSFLFGFDYWAARAARHAGVPVVLSARRELAHWQKRRHLWLLAKANALCDAATANAQAVADFAAQREGQPPGFYRVIYNGVADPLFTPPDRAAARQQWGIPQERPVVGMVANFSPIKDHTLFASAAAAVHRQHPEAFFALFGEGALREETARRLATAVGEDNFAIRHTTDNITTAHAAMDICVLTSRMEGSPNALMEAMAAGRPVVAPRRGGIPEIVAHGETGFLVEARNPDGFAQYILRLLRDADLRHAMGHAAQERMRTRFSAARMIDQHRACYRELLAAKGR